MFRSSPRKAPPVTSKKPKAPSFAYRSGPAREESARSKSPSRSKSAADTPMMPPALIWGRPDSAVISVIAKAPSGPSLR